MNLIAEAEGRFSSTAESCRVADSKMKHCKMGKEINKRSKSMRLGPQKHSHQMEGRREGQYKSFPDTPIVPGCTCGNRFNSRDPPDPDLVWEVLPTWWSLLIKFRNSTNKFALIQALKGCQQRSRADADKLFDCTAFRWISHRGTTTTFEFKTRLLC
jgi:hypothetical protein